VDPERWQRVKAILQGALERAGGERDGFLHEACGDDAALRDEVESLLAGVARGEALERTPHGAQALLDEPEAATADAGAGRLIGAYRVVRELGRGGMGTVVLAVRDDDEYQKRVAVKLLHPGTDSEDIVRRFRTERQILAAIDHPYVARLLDGGSTDDGLPYLVMEYVEGVPIDRYCDEHGLSITGRLILFRKVCEAVQVAHQNLIVHRDLKPGNILVTADGAPKLLDFGIAKLLNPELVAAPLDLTRSGRLPMTPEYASPEQIRGEPVTTASDVYALGVLLYELLTGHRPYRLAGLQFHEIARAICEDEPTRPSAVIDLVEEPGEGAFAGRALTPELVSRTREGTADRLRRRLRGDLDTIVLTALRKEAGRRYASVERLSEDVRRALEGLPIMARRATLPYRAGKFVRRHRAAVAAALVFVVSLTAFAVVTVRARIAAQSEAARARAVTDFLRETIGSAHPYRGRGRDVTVVEVLGLAVDELGRSFADRPELRAELQQTIGATYASLGRFDEAERLLRSSIETLGRTPGKAEPGVARSLVELGNVYREQSRFDDADRCLQEALRIRERESGPAHPDVAHTLRAIGNLRSRQGRNDEAAALFRRALGIQERELGPDDHEVAETLNSLAVVLIDQGELAEAEVVGRRALAIEEKRYGPDHVGLSAALHNLANLCSKLDRHEEAERLCQRSLAITERALGSDHPATALSLDLLALTYDDSDRPELAEQSWRRSISILESALGPTHPDLAFPLTNLGQHYVGLGRYAEAEPLLVRAAEIRESALGKEHPEVALTLANLALLHDELGRPAQAEELYLRALRIREKAGIADDTVAATILHNLAGIYVGQRRYPEAEPLFRRAHVIREEVLGASHESTLGSLLLLGLMLEAQGSPEAEATYRRLLKLSEEAFGPDYYDAVMARKGLARIQDSR
jgi:serine/threonine-protein kinase